MKYNPSIAFDKMSGSAKGVTVAKTRGRKYIRNRGYGGSTRTSYQPSVKAVFKQLSQAWQGLTNAHILAWNAAANTAQGKSVLGTKAKITGSNLFMRLNYWVVYCGGQIMETPPTLSGVEAPAAATIALSSSAMTFTLADIPSDVTNLKLIIQASEPQSNGVTRAYSKATAFADPYTPVTTAIDIKSAYDDQFVEYYYPDIEPWEQNITTKADFSSKWKDLYDQGVAGLVEGGGYQTKGVWRACEDCRMRTNDAPAFCPVCQRAIERIIRFYTEE